jgi:hypothetical protein
MQDPSGIVARRRSGHKPAAAARGRRLALAAQLVETRRAGRIALGRIRKEVAQ